MQRIELSSHILREREEDSLQKMKRGNKRRKFTSKAKTRPPPQPGSTSDASASPARPTTLTRTTPCETTPPTISPRLDTLPAELQQLIYNYAITSSKSSLSGIILATPEETLHSLFYVSTGLRAHLIEAVKAHGGKYLDACIRLEIYTYEFSMKYKKGGPLRANSELWKIEDMRA